MWINPDTFNNYFTMINNIAKEYKYTYDTIDKIIDISAYLEIFKTNKNINWGHLGYLLKILRDNNVINF